MGGGGFAARPGVGGGQGAGGWAGPGIGPVCPGGIKGPAGMTGLFGGKTGITIAVPVVDTQRCPSQNMLAPGMDRSGVRRQSFGLMLPGNASVMASRHDLGPVVGRKPLPGTHALQTFTTPLSLTNTCQDLSQMDSNSCDNIQASAAAFACAKVWKPDDTGNHPAASVAPVSTLL